MLDVCHPSQGGDYRPILGSLSSQPRLLIGYINANENPVSKTKTPEIDLQPPRVHVHVPGRTQTHTLAPIQTYIDMHTIIKECFHLGLGLVFPDRVSWCDFSCPGSSPQYQADLKLT